MQVGPGAVEVTLFDCDNTLLNNDYVVADLREHLEREFGPRNRDRYWGIFETLRKELGKDGRIVTPELSGSILEGITRDSILQIARDRGHAVEERKVSIDEWKQGVASGDIAEVFACGTAAVITPIGQLKGKGFEVGDPNAPAGEVTMGIRKELTDIQYGRVPDRHGWLVKLRD